MVRTFFLLLFFTVDVPCFVLAMAAASDVVVASQPRPVYEQLV